MDRHLTDALAALSDADLARLRSVADDAHGQTAGLLAAISHASTVVGESTSNCSRWATRSMKVISTQLSPQ
jgi:hypothetical protein